MRRKSLPPDFVTRSASCFSANSISRPFVSASFTVSADVSKACGSTSKKCFVPSTSPSHKSSIRQSLCNVLVAKSLCKFAARETELGHPRSDQGSNGQIGFHMKNPPWVRRRGGLTRGQNPGLLPERPHPAFAETTLPGKGRLARASALSLDAGCTLNGIFCSSNRTINR